MQNKAQELNSNKNNTLRRVSHTVFELEESHGHLCWNVTTLARKAKLSRSLIYEYLGSSKKEILLSSLRNFITEFYGLDDFKSPKTFAEQIQDARERMILYPDAILFYQKWRSKESWLQSEFIEIEKRFQRKLKINFPNLNEEQILSLHTIIHGLVTAPFLSSDQSIIIVKNLSALFFKNKA